MRSIYAGIALLGLAGSAAAQPHALGPQASLPYPACGDLAALRANLTGAPEPSPKSDAILRKLGVRCVAPSAPQDRAHY
ncbi:MAG TPA: hypothetical protein VGG79_04685 [Roseiarcus sp.]|jgi:hypothetical protein